MGNVIPLHPKPPEPEVYEKIPLVDIPEMTLEEALAWWAGCGYSALMTSNRTWKGPEDAPEEESFFVAFWFEDEDGLPAYRFVEAGADLARYSRQEILLRALQICRYYIERFAEEDEILYSLHWSDYPEDDGLVWMTDLVVDAP